MNYLKVTLLVNITIILCFGQVVQASANAVSQVVFSWTDAEGNFRKFVDETHPYTIPISNITTSYLYSKGPKIINVAAYDNDGFVLKSETLTLSVGSDFNDRDDNQNGNNNNPSVEVCTNLVANSKMDEGYVGYWRRTGYGDISIVDDDTSKNKALKYSPAVLAFRRGPLQYNSSRMGSGTRNCLQPSSKWIVYANVRLENRIKFSGYFSQFFSRRRGASCRIGFTCPSIHILIKDANDNILVDHKTSGDYTNMKWNPNLYNVIQSTFSMPSATVWDRRNPIKTISIELTGFSYKYDLFLDDFKIIPAR